MIYFEKSQPAPECLAREKSKASGDYKCGDVLDRLQTDFCNKCYICEMSSPPSINVEHFVPHENDVDHKFSWDNLFWSCAHCNNSKLARFKNLLNCTRKDDGVELRLRQTCNPFPHEQVRIEALDDDARTIETKILLEEVYNGTTRLKTMEAANIRDTLLLEIQDFQELLIYFFELKPFGDKAMILGRIEGHLNRKSSFTAIKRWIIRDNPVMYAKLGHLLTA